MQSKTARLFVQVLVIYNNRGLPNSVKSCQNWFKILPNTNTPSQTCPRLLKFNLWQNLVTLKASNELHDSFGN